MERYGIISSLNDSIQIDMKIGLDAMGGDFAPENEVLGAIEAYPLVKNDSRIVLFGDKAKIEAVCDKANFPLENFDVVHTTEVIDMYDHPAKAFTQKPNSSMVVAFKMLAAGKIDGFASPGNTGAMMAGVMYTVKTIEGIARPCISSTYPLVNGATGLLMDVGLNADCKPENLYQNAILGSLYAKWAMGLENPRVGLLNIGEEASKGNLLVKASYDLMKDSKDFNFVGNIEGYDVMTGKKADVVICDGFVGNIILKMAESFYHIAGHLGIDKEFFKRLNYETYGGTPILGVNAPVIIGHGGSSSHAIKNMILLAENVINAQLVKRVKDALSGN